MDKSDYDKLFDEFTLAIKALSGYTSLYGVDDDDENVFESYIQICRNSNKEIPSDIMDKISSALFIHKNDKNHGKMYSLSRLFVKINVYGYYKEKSGDDFCLIMNENEIKERINKCIIDSIVRYKSKDLKKKIFDCIDFHVVDDSLKILSVYKDVGKGFLDKFFWWSKSNKKYAVSAELILSCYMDCITTEPLLFMNELRTKISLDESVISDDWLITNICLITNESDFVTV